MVSLCVTLIGLADPALAAGTVVEEITLDAAGPDKPLPLLTPFFLKGVANPGVTEVHPIFVRNNYTALGFGNIVPRLGCNKVKQALELLQQDKDGPVLGKSQAQGVFGVEALWVRPSKDSRASADYDSLRRLHEAYAPTPWHREKVEDPNQRGQFKVLVSEPGFFRPGATYCLLMFERRRDRQQDTRSVRKALLTYGQDATAPCPGQVGPAPACPGSEPNAREALLDALDTLTSGLPDEAKTSISTTAQKAAGDMPSLFTAPKSLRNLLGSWEAERVYKTWDPPLLSPVADDPLARVIAWLLVRKGELHPVFNGDKVSFTPDGRLKANFVGLLADGQGIRIAEKKEAPSPDQWHVLQVTPESLKLPGSELSLQDLVEFASGRVKLGGSYEPFAGLSQGPLKEALAMGPEGPEGSPDPLEELGNQTERLQALMDRAWRTIHRFKGKDDGPRSPEEQIYYWLGRWLENQVVTTCSTVDSSSVYEGVLLTTSQPAVAGCQTDASPQSTGAWPGFSTTDKTPLGILKVLLRSYLDSREVWLSLQDKVNLVVVKQTVHRPETAPPRVGASLSQSGWFDHYVTTYTGYARLHSAADPFWFQQTGLQLYFWPNPVEEPMWANGLRDWRRLFALELGMGMSTGRFGPLDRYSGFTPSGTPPLLMGLAVQLLPYTTVSTGMTFLHARQTSLGTEKPRFGVQSYFGGSVQINVVGIIRNLATSDKPATTKGEL
jgi:hypothetical protein